MKKLYLVRHGETDLNAASVVQDGTSRLSDRGVAQAAALAIRFREIPARTLLVSDYVRTTQTAEPLAKILDLTPQYTPVLRETKRPTQFIGIETTNPYYQAYLEAANAHIADAAWHFEDEENYHDVMHRVREFFAMVEECEGDIVAVTHGRFITFLVSYVLLREELTPQLWLSLLRSYVTANTGITMFGYGEDESIWRLHTFNDIAHFAE